MYDDIIEESAKSVKLADIPENINDNKALYLKINIDNLDYLIPLSDIVEIKNTKLITPIITPSAKETNIIGTFYYQHEIIPIYNLEISSKDGEPKIGLTNKQDSVILSKNNKLFIIYDEGYCGLIINNILEQEIININYSTSNDNYNDIEILNLKKLV